MVLPSLDESTGIRVDFIFSFTTYESQAISRANKIKILEHDVCFASAMKKMRNSIPKQKLSVSQSFR